jgi:hemolysin activation/secretion protein
MRRRRNPGRLIDRSVLGLAACFVAVTAAWPAEPPVPQGSPLPRMAPPALPSAAPAVEAPLLPPPGTEVPNRPVKVVSTAIEGATVYVPAELAHYTDGLIGPATPLPKIDAARQALLQQYRSQGFVLTTVSVKLDAAGHLRFIVTEGRIAAVKLDGDIGPAGVQVLRFLNRLTETTPIDSLTLERYLLLAQDVPGVTVRAVLQPSTDQPGALTLIAQVSRKEIGGSISADNRAFNQTGPYETLGVLDFNSYTSLGEKTELSYYHTFPNSQNFGQVSEEFFVGSSGLKVKIYAGYGQVNPTGQLGQSGYQGTTTVFGTQVTYPVIRTRQQTLNVFAAFDGLESRIDTGTPPTRASYDSLRVLRVGEDYVRSDTWLGGNRPALNTASIRISQGLQILGASTNGTSAISPRQHERTDFTKFNFEFSRTQTLFSPWDGATVALMGLVTGQWSGDILPPAEQFYLGGNRFTRGYYSGQVPGDKALAATAELQLNTGFSAPFLRDDGDVPTQFYVFYDWGQTWQNQPADLAVRIASAGGGTRVQVTRYAELDVEALGRFNVYPTGGQGNTGVSALNGFGLYWRVLGHF